MTKPPTDIVAKKKINEQNENVTNQNWQENCSTLDKALCFAPQVAMQQRLTGCELQCHRQPGRRDEEDEEGQRVVRTLFMNLVWAGALASCNLGESGLIPVRFEEDALNLLNQCRSWSLNLSASPQGHCRSLV